MTPGIEQGSQISLTDHHPLAVVSLGACGPFKGLSSPSWGVYIATRLWPIRDRQLGTNWGLVAFKGACGLVGCLAYEWVCRYSGVWFPLDCSFALHVIEFWAFSGLQT